MVLLCVNINEENREGEIVDDGRAADWPHHTRGPWNPQSGLFWGPGIQSGPGWCDNLLITFSETDARIERYDVTIVWPDVSATCDRASKLGVQKIGNIYEFTKYMVFAAMFFLFNYFSGGYC